MGYLRTVYDWVLLALGGIFGWLFGGFCGGLVVFVFFIMIDMLFGVFDCIVNKGIAYLQTKIALAGVVRKLGECVIISMCHVLDVYIIKTGDVLMQAACFLLIGTEGISILIHMRNLKVPFPKKLIVLLEKLRNVGDASLDNIIKGIDAKTPSDKTTDTKEVTDSE